MFEFSSPLLGFRKHIQGIQTEVFEAEGIHQKEEEIMERTAESEGLILTFQLLGCDDHESASVFHLKALLHMICPFSGLMSLIMPTSITKYVQNNLDKERILP